MNGIFLGYGRSKIDLIIHFYNYSRARASHKWLDKEERLRMGITEDFIRLSVGLEGPEALIGDLDQALTDTLG